MAATQAKVEQKVEPKEDPKKVVPRFFGTVPPKEVFDKADEAGALRTAFEDDDDKEVIKILTSLNNAQRLEVEDAYYEKFGRDLRRDLVQELSGRVEDVAVRLLYPPTKYDAIELHKAMESGIADDKSLIEILVTRSNAELREIRENYKSMFDRDLIEDLQAHTFCDFRTLATSLAQGRREEGGVVDARMAMMDARQLYAAGEDYFWETDTKVFSRILTRRSFAMLKEINKCYRKVADHDLSVGMAKEMNHLLDFPFRRACLAIVAYAKDPPTFFADCMQQSTDGVWNGERRMIRQVISRSEIDLSLIKERYLERHGEELLTAVKCDTTGDFREIMIRLIKEKKQVNE